MNVNGEEKCHWAEKCIQLPKRSQVKAFPIETHERNIDYPTIEESLGV